MYTMTDMILYEKGKNEIMERLSRNYDMIH